MSYACPIPSVEVERNFDPEYYLGIGKESKRIQEDVEEVWEHFSIPISRRKESPRINFNKLKQEWIEETKTLSSISEICMHPAYQQIIGMGKTIISYIIQEMVENPNHWFWALKSITGVDPVPPDKRGQMEKMTSAWFKWWLVNKENL
jgi:hypothetical protein